MGRRPVSIPQDKIQEAISNTSSMKAAANFLGVTYSSFLRYAKKFELFAPNRGGKGTKKPNPALRLPLSSICVKGSSYKSAALKVRLLNEGLKKNQCEDCGQLPFWNGKPLVLQLDHIDGDSTNNEFSNLRLLCPNCHTQTPTYCRGQGKSGKKTLCGRGEAGRRV